MMDLNHGIEEAHKQRREEMEKGGPRQVGRGGKSQPVRLGRNE